MIIEGKLETHGNYKTASLLVDGKEDKLVKEDTFSTMSVFVSAMTAILIRNGINCMELSGELAEQFTDEMIDMIKENVKDMIQDDLLCNQN